jgi:hypothetical protein
MNDPATTSNPNTTTEPVADNNAVGTSQVPLSRKLTQEIKDQLKELKKDTTASYPLGAFLTLVVENHWMSEMERIRKTFEKLKTNKQ